MTPLCQSILRKHSRSKDIVWQSLDATNENAQGLERAIRIDKVEIIIAIYIYSDLLQMDSNWHCGGHHKGHGVGSELHGDACR